MQDKIFYSICFGFILGVLMRSFFIVNLYIVFLVGIISFALFLFFLFISRNIFCIIFFTFILTFCLGFLRLHNVDKYAPEYFELQVGVNTLLNGFIIDEPENRENNQRLTVLLKNNDEKTRVLITTNFDNNFRYGDEIEFQGKLKKPDNFLTDQGKEFDYINYLRKDNIFYLANSENVDIVSHGNGNVVKSFLFTFKNNFLSKINKVVPSPENTLLGGLILGERSSFSSEMRQKFIDTGTIHIVALSGYNVTIVAEYIMKMFSFLPQTLGFIAGVLGILLFVIMAGGQSTAVRAGVMASLALIARATGRTYDVARALAFAGVSMILLNPFVLVYDVSFQLSFIATVAVIFLAPKMERYFLWITKKGGLRDVVSVTVSVYVFVLPFILYKMGNLSFVALPANILILPLIPITMIFGFLTGFLGFISYIFAVPTGYISYLLLHYELRVIDILSHLPMASFTVSNFPLFITLLIYVYFIYKLFGRNIKSFLQHKI